MTQEVRWLILTLIFLPVQYLNKNQRKKSENLRIYKIVDWENWRFEKLEIKIKIGILKNLKIRKLLFSLEIGEFEFGKVRNLENWDFEEFWKLEICQIENFEHQYI